MKRPRRLRLGTRKGRVRPPRRGSARTVIRRRLAGHPKRRRSQGLMPKAARRSPRREPPEVTRPSARLFIEPPSLPDHFNPVAPQLGIGGHQGKALKLGLGDQHAVEGVAMVRR